MPIHITTCPLIHYEHIDCENIIPPNFFFSSISIPVNLLHCVSSVFVFIFYSSVATASPEEYDIAADKWTKLSRDLAPQFTGDFGILYTEHDYAVAASLTQNSPDFAVFAQGKWTSVIGTKPQGEDHAYSSTIVALRTNEVCSQ